MKVKLTNVRLAFPALFNAKAVKSGDKAAFSAAFIFEGKADPACHVRNEEDTAWVPSTLSAVIQRAANDKWGAKGAEQLKALRAADKALVHDGDGKSEFDGYANNLFLNARNGVRPTVIDANKSPLTEADGKPYAGCYVIANIDVWAQDNQYGKRINASLGGVQFLRDGDAFSGGAPSSLDEFDDIADGADAGSLV